MMCFEDMDFSKDYWRGFSCGENMYDRSGYENESMEFWKGYEDGLAQASEDCPELFL